VSRSVKAHLLLVLITFIWGATFVLIKNALADMSPLLLNAVRMSLAAALLAIIYHREFSRMSRPAIIAGVAVGVFLWLGYEFQTAGLKFTTPSKSAFLTGASVVFVPLCLALFWRRKINRWTIIGVIGAFIGLYLLAVPVGPNGELFSLGGINIGDALTIGCAISFTFHIILVGRATQRFPYAQIVLVQMIVGALLMVVTAPVLERPMVIWSPRVLWAIAITAIFATVIAFTVQAWAQQFTPPTHTALIFALEPFFALATSYIVVGERLGLRAGFGAALILASVLVSELLPGAMRNQAELVSETSDA
jgi:drug/metabolite transporter (DMT)-like permease